VLYTHEKRNLFFHITIVDNYVVLVGFPVDTVEDKSGFTVKADLPGVSKDKLKINYQDRWLAIESERPCEPENGSTFVERPCGLFQRHIRLPVAVKPETINAKLQDGVLTVRMTKEKPGDPVTVPIS
jgi:HSP20 family protein